VRPGAAADRNTGAPGVSADPYADPSEHTLPVAAPAATSASAHHTIRRESHTDLNRSTIRVAPFPINTHTHPSNYTAHHTRTKKNASFVSRRPPLHHRTTHPSVRGADFSFFRLLLHRASVCEPPRRPINIYLPRLLCRGATRSTPPLPFRNRICRRLTPTNNRNTQCSRHRQRGNLCHNGERRVASQHNLTIASPLLLLSAGREPVVVGTTIPRPTGCGNAHARSSLVYARVHTHPLRSLTSLAPPCDAAAARRV
jgi:hypothetical protein